MIVLHPSHATPVELWAALQALKVHRARRPEPVYDYVIAIPDVTRMRQPDSRSTAALQANLAELLTQPRSHLEKLGTARWIEIADVSLYP